MNATANIDAIVTTGIPTTFAYTLIVTADGTARTISFAFTKWRDGVVPTPSSVSGRKDVYVMLTTDGGVNWLGFAETGMR